MEEESACPKCSRILDEENFRYVRDVPGDPRSRGQWTCQGCQTVIYPNTDPASTAPTSFSEIELNRLLILEVLHSNDGFGTRFRTDGKIASWLPEPATLLEQAAANVVD